MNQFIVNLMVTLLRTQYNRSLIESLIECYVYWVVPHYEMLLFVVLFWNTKSSKHCQRSQGRFLTYITFGVRNPKGRLSQDFSIPSTLMASPTGDLSSSQSSGESSSGLLGPLLACDLVSIPNPMARWDPGNGNLHGLAVPLVLVPATPVG